MALIVQGGWPVDSTTGQLLVTTQVAGATMVGGFLRDAAGRLVVRYA